MDLLWTISTWSGATAYGLLVVFCAVGVVRGYTGRALFAASALTGAWLTCRLFPDLHTYDAFLEALALLAWIMLSLRALGVSWQERTDPAVKATFLSAIAAVVFAAMAIVTSTPVAGDHPIVAIAHHLAFIALSVSGLVLLEQFARNTIGDLRWRSRYLVIGLSLMFGYELFHHAFAILLGAPVIMLSALQPGIVALSVPFIVIASLRNRSNELRINLSRNFVFRTGVLVATGTFLLLLGLFGYIAQIFAGQLGLALAVYFGIVLIALLAVVVGSSQFRTRARIAISKALFEYKYEYRDEWIRVSELLTEPNPDFDLPQQVQRAMVGVLSARRSCLWLMTGNDHLVARSHINATEWRRTPSPRLSRSLVDFYDQQNWVIDLSAPPEEAEDVIKLMHEDFEDTHMPAYIVPLSLDHGLVGVVLVGPSEATQSLSWEDYDILKLISRQCAGFLALEEATRHVGEQEQLSAMNQVSAFLIHDLKTITAQLTLMLQNAEVHKTNPDFVTDMLSTTENSVARMQNIVTQLRKPSSDAEDTVAFAEIELSAFTQKVLDSLTQPPCRLSTDLPTDAVRVNGDAERTRSALTHVLQNAIEAAGTNGAVEVTVSRTKDWGIVAVTDTGPGMSEEFIGTQLFTPFRTSKGLSGMGIGAYQARQYVRACGGDIEVESAPGQGCTMHIKLPLAARRD